VTFYLNCILWEINIVEGAAPSATGRRRETCVKMDSRQTIQHGREEECPRVDIAGRGAQNELINGDLCTHAHPPPRAPAKAARNRQTAYIGIGGDAVARGYMRVL